MLSGLWQLIYDIGSMVIAMCSTFRFWLYRLLKSLKVELGGNSANLESQIISAAELPL
jgi:hypothetical protein